MWLRICELINDPLTPPAEALDEVLWMVSEFSEHYTVQLLAVSAAKDISTLLGVPWDPSILWVGTYQREVAETQALLSDPVPEIPLPVIADLVGLPQVANVPDRELFASKFNEVLRVMLGEEMAKGRKSSLYPPRNTRQEEVLLFDGFAYYGDPQKAEVSVLVLRGGRPWRDFLRGLAAVVCANVFWDWQRLPWAQALLLSDEQTDRVIEILHGRRGRDDPGEAPEEEWDDSPEDAAWEDDGFPVAPMVVQDPDAVRTMPRAEALARDIRRHAGSTARARRPYVPSGFRCMSYDRMNRSQLEYYLGWRADVAGGVYRDTDRGYLWLLLCEIVDSDSEPERRLEMLKSLHREYGSSSDAVGRMVERTCIDYAFLTDQTPPWFRSYSDKDLVIWLRLSRDPPAELSMDLLEGMVGVDIGKYAVVRNGGYDGALNAAVRAMDAHLRSHGGRGLAERIGASNRIQMREVFPDLCHGWDRYIRVTVCDFSPRSAAAMLLTSAAKVAIRAVNGRAGARRPNRPTKVDGNLLAAMEAGAEDFLSGSERAKAAEKVRREAMSIVLDMDAVKGAEEDLRAVTDLVSVEDVEEIVGEECVEEPLEPAEEPSGSPWENLASQLTDVQKGYLRACLDGSGSSFLKSNNLSEVTMEDSINSLSMDAVGDQVVEAGEVFEDYADELSAVLRFLWLLRI